MINKDDHYQSDDFKPVKSFSFGNILLTFVLLAIAAITAIGLWQRPPVDVEPQAVIPWSPHPKR